MRRRKAQAINRTLISLAAITSLSALGAAGGVTVARGETATMSGTLGIAPNYASVPNLCPCTPLRHSVMPTQAGLADMVRVIDRWAATPTAAVPSEPRRLVTFSATTQGATGWVRDNVDDAVTREVEIVAMGSSETPGNGWKGSGHKRTEGLPTDQGAVYDNFVYVVRQFDPIADKAANPNFWSRINEKLSTHINGYDDIDLDNPDAEYVDPTTGSTTKYYRSDVLPMLRWRQGFTSDERMSELDARYRPRIEAAYDRPVDLGEAWKDGGESDDSDQERGSSVSETTTGSTTAARTSVGVSTRSTLSEDDSTDSGGDTDE